MTKKRSASRRSTPSLIALILTAAAFFVHRVGVEMHYRWQWPVILQYLVRTDGGHWAAGTLAQGFLMTVKLSLWATVLATLLGTILGLLRVSRSLFCASSPEATSNWSGTFRRWSWSSSSISSSARGS